MPTVSCNMQRERYHQHGQFMVLMLVVAFWCHQVASTANGVAAHRVRRSSTPPAVQAKAAEDLIGRLLGEHKASLFHLTIVPTLDDSGHDHYTLSTRSVGTTTQVRIQGTSGVALASGFYWYLKYFCNCSVSWGVNGTGNNLILPSPLPALHTPLTMQSPVKYRYYLNVCTHSYSAVWWGWDRWEQEIDWMALHGINLPLSSTGQEHVFAQVFLELGLNVDDLQGFFVGPAFLAWGRMGNIQGWGGPLASEWRRAQAELQKRIVERQRQLGMIPILPGFAGFVPKGITRIYPNANLTHSSDWARFPPPYSPTYFLSPLDSLYKKIGAMIIRRNIQEYGTDHVYSADTFNEMSPPSSDPEYLAAASRAVYEGMSVEDSEALWVMQGWSFVFDPFWNNDRIKAYLSGVDNRNLLILDLASDNSPEWDKTDSYFGKDFVWCMLHNGGGVRGLYGNLTQYSTDPLLALATPGNTMVGVGMTMEAIEQNPVVYELMSEMGWRSEPFDLSAWITRYAERRYRSQNSQMVQAWRLLREATYEQSGLDTAFFGLTPGLGMGYGGASDATKEVYALRLFLQATPSDPNGPWLYDCVDLMRQVLANTFRDVYNMFDSAYTDYANNRTASTQPFRSLGAALLDIIMDTDALLRSNSNFLLGAWIRDALSWANSPYDEKLIQFNARNQITLWGPTGQISDYATKHWADLLSTYYLPRWNLFVELIQQAVSSKGEFDASKYNKELLQLELRWNNLTTTYQTQPSGNTVDISKALLNKYLDASRYYPKYRKVASSDVKGSDLMEHTTWSKDIAQLMWYCSLNPACKGFNTNGWLKRDVSNQIPSNMTNLYIKL